MGRKRQISLDTASQVKTDIWKGISQEDIAERLGLSQATISNIKTGRLYFEALWPNGDAGPLPRSMESVSTTKKKEILPVYASDPLARWRSTIPAWKMELLEKGIAEAEQKIHDKKQGEIEKEMDAARLRQAEYKRKRDAGLINAAPRQDPFGPLVLSELDLLTWEQVLDRAPTCSFVIAAEQAADDELKDVLRVLFSGDFVPSDEQLSVLIPKTKVRMVRDGTEST